MKKRVDLAELLSYDPSPQLVRMILSDVAKTGKCIEECADRFAMPPLFYVGKGDTFQYKGETMNSKEFERRFPYRRFVILRVRQPELETE